MKNNNSMLDRGSLVRTVDAVNAAAFFEEDIAAADRLATARWIAGRQGMEGAYRELFAPTAADQKAGTRVFSGEVMQYASARHVLGEEACRALRLLGVRDRTVAAALERATADMVGYMDQILAEWKESRLGSCLGTFCCGNCTVSVWRHLTAGGLDRAEARLAAGMKSLRDHRDGKGRWRIYPFHYTLAALTEMELPGARAEMRYAAPLCEKIVRRSPGADELSRRRRAVAERVLERA